MMGRYRRGMALRPVNRIKHVVDTVQTLTAGTVLDLNQILAVDAPVLANTTEVVTGSKVHGIYLRVNIAGNESDPGALPSVYMAVWKNPGGNLASIDPRNVGANDNKRFVIHQEMTMIQNAIGGNPRDLFNGVIVIPKGMQRFGPNDKLILGVVSTAVNIAVCVQAHYKEFR